MHHHNEHEIQPNHTNLFVDLNGVPYVLAEYLDKRSLQKVDRSQITDNIFIDLTESMRAIIDISIDDIGKRGGDGLPNIRGNNTKQRELLKMVNMHKENFHRQLPTMARGIIVKVSYQLENIKTGHIIRSMTEDLRILDRNYFLDINPRNVEDNAIIVNFSNSMMSTINEFTHGRERMMIRITNLQLYYECLSEGYKMAHKHQTLVHPDYPGMMPGHMNENDYYNYHHDMQNHHFIGHPEDAYGHEHPGMISPPTWTQFNRFYHFDNCGKDVIFHEQEVLDPTCQRRLIPCGSVRVNRTFLINPGHRLIFKISIWKNDVTVVNDCRRIAELLEAPVYDYNIYDGHDHHHHEHHEHHHPDFDGVLVNPDYEATMKNMNEQLNAQMAENNRLSHIIEDLIGQIGKLQDIVMKNHPEIDDMLPEDPPEIEVPGQEEPPEEDSGCGGCCCDGMEEISAEEVRDMFKK